MSGKSSLAHRLAALSRPEREALLAEFGLRADQVEQDWKIFGRPDQQPPPGEWRTWLLLGGRGAGKTRTAAEWIRSEITSGRRRSIGAVGPTAESLRRTMVEGVSGLLNVGPADERPVYEMTIGRVVYPNGGVVHLFSAEQPDRLRGPNLDGLWIDELCSMDNAQAVWDMAAFATRLTGPQGHPAQVCITTTPRPTPTLKLIMAAPDTVVTKSRTLDNANHLDPASLAGLLRTYGGTSLGRQELEAEILDQADHALWTRAMLEECRVPLPPEQQTRVVVAIDPSGGTADSNSECGIIVACKGADGHGYVLADASGRLSPERWARRAIDLYEQYRADRIIAEQNFGGQMVENTIKMVDAHVPVKLVVASRGKQQRCEPVVALYEQQRIHHVGVYSRLEDQMCQHVFGVGGPSPDRIDALVWAMSELLVENTGIDIEMCRRLIAPGHGYDRLMTDMFGHGVY